MMYVCASFTRDPETDATQLWAGILFLAVSAGFVAISAYTLRAYASTGGFQGGGFNDSSNTFGLNTNTLVLFAFVLVTALVLGYAYVSLARIFTKQFIWISGILNIVMALGTAVYYFVSTVLLLTSYCADSFSIDAPGLVVLFGSSLESSPSSAS